MKSIAFFCAAFGFGCCNLLAATVAIIIDNQSDSRITNTWVKGCIPAYVKRGEVCRIFGYENIPALLDIRDLSGKDLRGLRVMDEIIDEGRSEKRSHALMPECRMGWLVPAHVAAVNREYLISVLDNNNIPIVNIGGGICYRRPLEHYGQVNGTYWVTMISHQREFQIVIANINKEEEYRKEALAMQASKRYTITNIYHRTGIDLSLA
jgi:hypothetical protein